MSNVLFTSLVLAASLTPVVHIAGVSAEPGTSGITPPMVPPVAEPGGSDITSPAVPPTAEKATSPQIKPGISPDQPVKPKIRYECKNEADKLSTVAHTERGVIELIVWESNYFGSSWSPTRRCETVTQRFQQFSDQRLLRFVSTGTLNNYNVICISEKQGDCIDQGLLITLERGDQPTRVLRQLFNYRSSIRRGPRRPTKEVINFERLLNERAPIETPSAIGGSEPTLPSETLPPSETPE
ncbi:COP23 domain-containing protein [Acaryochloris sp. IP29b_bin.148]|uniref:COP23 domain-containing protein n=1 Tax=Acaryochloris sp. IP29b_bin.148 TaxID=2969218 RepID=UPI002617A8CD|nr:COP23 domain-containing protein [Acaryochloris sp. IP29b_bin.148]